MEGSLCTIRVTLSDSAERSLATQDETGFVDKLAQISMSLAVDRTFSPGHSWCNDDRSSLLQCNCLCRNDNIASCPGKSHLCNPAGCSLCAGGAAPALFHTSQAAAKVWRQGCRCTHSSWCQHYCRCAGMTGAHDIRPDALYVSVLIRNTGK